MKPAKIYYLIECKELHICRQFADKATAQAFAKQLAKDYPTAKIERWECRGFFAKDGQNEN